MERERERESGVFGRSTSGTSSEMGREVRSEHGVLHGGREETLFFRVTLEKEE